ncbi:DNA mismatch repair endonuclease MutL [uncultured Oscillibacter sp.]|uniref:DNA mismatch repair endonuclease MutL n=1 Tax=uncultured Oscillibacter sp. TaxID=876091 RepID=UPI00280A8204|nr:DNA mismatch repair endonuclease MutL [uncultured Oscillibacter sp.]
MPHIQQLDRHVSELIAAGEVVERPASVVKELVENAIDAGSSAVVVEIQRGGMGLIRVTDNGCGIAPAELPTAFLRHATSKLRTGEDLGRIGTLGFRGEALAAIAAVSRVEICTREKGADAGARLRLEGGTPGAVEETGAAEGTTISVRDLFFNTPARLKFMRKDSAETAAVAGLMQHLALSHPDISFKFIKDGTEALHTPGDGRLDSTIYASLGRDFARSLIPVSGRGGEVAVEGFVTKPLMGRGSRSMQVFFVNGRFIKSQLLTAAVEEGYRNQIMKGKFPGCVLCVTLPVTAVDVNVHPAKTQVKFAREREVFDAVYHTVLDCLDADGAPRSAAPQASQTLTAPARQDFFKTMDAATFRAQQTGGEKKPAASQTPSAVRGWNTERPAASVRMADILPPKPARGPALGSAPASAVTRQTEEAKREGTVFGGSHAPVKDSAPAAQARPAVQAQPSRPVPSPAPAPVQTALYPEAKAAAESTRTERPFVPAIPQPRTGEDLPGQQTLDKAEAPWRMVGEVLHTYIICESAQGEVWLIDKHAAHERVNFDRLMASHEPPMQQMLLRPVAAELGREDAALLLEHLDTLESLGFSCEDFGGDTVLVRQIPADLDASDVTATLEELAQKLRSGRSSEEKREALLHTMACKASIKGGWTSDPAELRVLVEKVQRGEVKYCPHGRPVAVKLTKYQIEKMFGRA